MGVILIVYLIVGTSLRDLRKSEHRSSSDTLESYYNFKNQMKDNIKTVKGTRPLFPALKLKSFDLKTSIHQQKLPQIYDSLNIQKEEMSQIDLKPDYKDPKFKLKPSLYDIKWVTGLHYADTINNEEVNYEDKESIFEPKLETSFTFHL